MNFQMVKEKDEKPLKFNSTTFYTASSSVSSKSVAFYIVFLIWFSQPCFLILAFAIPSDRLCLVILASLLLVSLFVYQGHFFCYSILFKHHHYLYPTFNTIAFYHSFNVPYLVLFLILSSTDVNILVVFFFSWFSRS